MNLKESIELCVRRWQDGAYKYSPPALNEMAQLTEAICDVFRKYGWEERKP